MPTEKRISPVKNRMRECCTYGSVRGEGGNILTYSALRPWEHAIRDDANLERHIDYIHFNPVKHGLVSRVRDWPHSSFKEYVARGDLPPDWGGDVKNLTGEYGE